MNEYATLRGKSGFRKMIQGYLERTGQTFAELEKRQVPDELGESLRLRMRALQAKYARK